MLGVRCLKEPGLGAGCYQLMAEEIVQQRSKIHLKVSCHFAQNLAQGSDANGPVGRDCDVVGPITVEVIRMWLPVWRVTW